MNRKYLKILRNIDKFEISDTIGEHKGQIYLDLDYIYTIIKKNKYMDKRNINDRISEYFSANYTYYNQNVAKNIVDNSEKLNQLRPKLIVNGFLTENGKFTYINIDEINDYLNWINTINRILKTYNPIKTFLFGLIGGVGITLMLKIVINIIIN